MANTYELIIEKLKQNNLTISCVESVTAGMISAFLSNVPGASKVLKGGLVVYSNYAKEHLAHVKHETLQKHGAISEQTAYELALNTAKLLNTDLAISITGNAGPIPDENKPIGMAYIGLAVIDKVYIKKIQSSQSTRNDIRVELCSLTFEFINEILDKIIKK